MTKRRTMTRWSLAISAMLFSTTAQAATCMTGNEGAAWRAAYPAIYNKLMPFLACIDDADDAVACNVFASRAADALYGVTDFKRADGSYLTANSIVDAIKKNPAWSRLGYANDQSVLNNAAAGANDHLIIAAMKDQPHGHVALILPGATQASSTWNLKVPNSASAFLDDAANSYVFCRLSWAFSDPAKVEIWWRPKVN